MHWRVDFLLRHLGHQGPVEVAQGQAERQVAFAVTAEAAAAQAFAAGHQHLGGIRAELFGELAFAAEGSVRMNLDQAIVTHQEHLAVLAKFEVMDQLRQFGHAQAHARHTDQLAILFHAIVDEQRELAGGTVDVDVDQAFGTAVDVAVEPFVLGVAAAEGTVQAILVVVVAGFGRDEQGGEGLVALLGGGQVFNEWSGLGGVFTGGKPVAQQGVAGNIRRRHQRLAEHALDVVADGLDAGGQRGIDQVAFGEAVERHRENDDHHQDARQQGGTHAGDQLPLDALTPDTHAPTPRTLLFCGKCIHLRIQLIQ
ncbi:hypothetical protein D3C72_1426610 [compost metagenome]